MSSTLTFNNPVTINVTLPTETDQVLEITAEVSLADPEIVTEFRTRAQEVADAAAAVAETQSAADTLLTESQDLAGEMNVYVSQIAQIGQTVTAYHAEVVTLAGEAEDSSTLASSMADSAKSDALTAQDARDIAVTSAGEAADSATSAGESATAAAQDRALVVAAKESVDSATATVAEHAATVATQAGEVATAHADSITARDLTLAAQLACQELFEQFSDQYLGAYEEDPTLDNDGEALQVGASYLNSSANELRFYSGTAWVSPEAIATEAAARAEAAKASVDDSEANVTSLTETATTAATTATEAKDVVVNAQSAIQELYDQIQALAEDMAGASELDSSLFATGMETREMLVTGKVVAPAALQALMRYFGLGHDDTSVEDIVTDLDTWMETGTFAYDAFANGPSNNNGGVVTVYRSRNRLYQLAFPDAGSYSYRVTSNNGSYWSDWYSVATGQDVYFTHMDQLFRRDLSTALRNSTYSGSRAKFVIGVVKLNQTTVAYSSGTIMLTKQESINRNNAVPPITIRYTMNEHIKGRMRWSSFTAVGDIDNSAFNDYGEPAPFFKPCVFTKNGIVYGGIEVVRGNAQFDTAMWEGTSTTPPVLFVYNDVLNPDTALEDSINYSIAFEDEGYFIGTKRIATQDDIQDTVESSVETATADLQRTIGWGPETYPNGSGSYNPFIGSVRTIKDPGRYRVSETASGVPEGVTEPGFIICLGSVEGSTDSGDVQYLAIFDDVIYTGVAQDGKVLEPKWTVVGASEPLWYGELAEHNLLFASSTGNLASIPMYNSEGVQQLKNYMVCNCRGTFYRFREGDYVNGVGQSGYIGPADYPTGSMGAWQPYTVASDSAKALDTDKTLTIGASGGKVIDGSSDVSFTLDEIGAAAVTASDTQVGGIKIRQSGSTFYITTDGSNP